MRHVLIAATTVGLLAFASAGPASAANPNVPSWSPYAIGAYGAAPPAPVNLPGPGAGMTEGRAAYVDGDPEAVPSRPLPASRGGDIIVHTGRSYLDPGASAEIGTEDRYFYDTAHYNLGSEGPAFTQNTAGFELLH